MLHYIRAFDACVPEFITLISGLSFTESPRWRDGRPYVSDFYTHRVLAVAMDGTAEISWAAPQPVPLSFMCVETDGTAWVAADELGFPNGMALTSDNRTLIVAESAMNRLSAFHVASGSLGERRTWAAFGDPPASTDVSEVLGQAAVVPDGICLDAEGAVWVADAATVG